MTRISSIINIQGCDKVRKQGNFEPKDIISEISQNISDA